MSTRTKILITLAVIVIAGIITYFVFFKKSAVSTNVPLINTAPGTSKPGDSDAFPLNVGSRGNNVQRLQTALNFINPSNPLVVDGDFGSKTRVKLLTTVPVTLSKLPMDETAFNTLIQQGNDTMINAAAGSISNPDAGSYGTVLDLLGNTGQ